MSTPGPEALAPERTVLAWRRTALGVAVLSAVAVRFTVPHLGWPALVLGAFGLVLAAVAYGVSGGRRARSASRTGIASAALAVAAALLGLVALGYVVIG